MQLNFSIVVVFAFLHMDMKNATLFLSANSRLFADTISAMAEGGADVNAKAHGKTPLREQTFVQCPFSFSFCCFKTSLNLKSIATG
jgi:hypothetical protein